MPSAQLDTGQQITGQQITGQQITGQQSTGQLSAGRNDAWRQALGSGSPQAEVLNRRPKPGPGRHRHDSVRIELWQRALTGPPISTHQP